MRAVGLLLCSSLVVACATTTPPRMTLDEAVREGHAEPAASNQLLSVLERFVAGAQVRRERVKPGSAMPAAQVEGWTEVLEVADAFLKTRTSAAWLRTAMQARLRLEGELAADARVFGDVPGPLAERVTGTLRQLSSRIARAAPRERVVDPRRFLWPVDPVIVSSPYGDRNHPIKGGQQFHAGIDLQAPTSQPVMAAESGVVVFSGFNGAHGNQVEVRHNAHWTTRYSHLDAALVAEGAVVKRGQTLGLVGETGLTTGPHLHFELRRDGDALDPEVFLRMPGAPTPLVSYGVAP